MIPRGHSLGFDQIILSEQPQFTTNEFKLNHQPISVSEHANSISVKAADIEYQFDQYKGTIQQIRKAGEPWLNQPADFNIWRAPLDNDSLIKAHWLAAGYDRATSRVYDYRLTEQESAVEIIFKLGLVAVSKARILTLNVEYLIEQNGVLHINIHAEKQPHLPFYHALVYVSSLIKDLTKWSMWAMAQRKVIWINITPLLSVVIRQHQKAIMCLI